MRGKWTTWILVLVVVTGLVYFWLIQFRSLFIKVPSEFESEGLWEGAGWATLTGESPAGLNQAAATPDAVTGATPRIIALRVKNVVEQIRPSVVGICVGGGGEPPPWQQGWEAFSPSGRSSIGSGIIVHPHGYIITNYHVISAGGDIKVSVFSAAGYQEYPALLVGGDQKIDLALIKINANYPLPSAPLGDSNKVRVGDQVLAMGNPFGLTQTVTKGIISARRDSLTIGNRTMSDLFQTDVPINPGNSGGALCNLMGEVIGINVAIYSPLESVYTGVSFAIPINRSKMLYGNYMDLANRPVNYQWVANQPGSYRRVLNAPGAITGAEKRIMPSPGEGIEEIAWLGIDFVPDALGVEVDEVEGITPMEAGLQAGDIIKEVNGHPISDIYALKNVIKEIPLENEQGIVLYVRRPRVNKGLYISFRLKEWDLRGR